MNFGSSIFFYEGYVGIAPTIVNSAKMLNKNGYFVTIYATKNDYPSPGNLGENIKIAYFPKAARLLDLMGHYFSEIVPLLAIVFYTIQCIIEVVKTARSPKKSINIGVDIYGAVTALICFWLFGQKFLLLSLELHNPEDKFKGFSTIIVKLAKLAYKKSEGLMIQDEDRFKVFCQYYQYQHERVFYLPNSTLATNERSPDVGEVNYFRDKFNLSEEEFPYLILQAGMISDAVFSSALARAFTSIEKCALIFHDRQKRRADDPAIAELRQINSKNLFLSLEPLPYDRVDTIYIAPTIGLAFYADISHNFSQISMASGKLPQYLKWGKPVLVSDLPSLSKLVDRYRFGLIIKDPSDATEIKEAIAQIVSDYDNYSRNAKACFDAEFDFSKKMQPILAFMNSFVIISGTAKTPKKIKKSKRGNYD